jgi:predicted DNA-binding transcriptional regulator AlpA
VSKRSHLLASARLAGSNIAGTSAIAGRKTAPPTHTTGGPLEDDPLIGTAEVAHELNCHPVSVYRKMREDPEFPVPMWITSNRLAWRRSWIRGYVASRPLRETRNRNCMSTMQSRGPRAGTGGMADDAEGSVEPDKVINEHS